MNNNAETIQGLVGDNLLSNTAGMINTLDALQGTKYVGLYFSAHWCPPCRAFLPHFIEFYELMKKKGAGLEIIFLSGDKSEGEYQEYFSNMPWLALPYVNKDILAALKAKYKCTGIPFLVLIDMHGKVITTNARAEINIDPTGSRFPWAKKKSFCAIS